MFVFFSTCSLAFSDLLRWVSSFSSLVSYFSSSRVSSCVSLSSSSAIGVSLRSRAAGTKKLRVSLAMETCL